eukprot:TRINITY_DN3392_c0_g8_i4.p1 TRINITY_DN3392_c0_g8~~TRINITY_DN3392_c0_g8_i4.p1  ORF type:complete len:457 (-),score=44.80 TRINITY_DN3392_c0_g8_i4:937-2307(-)
MEESKNCGPDEHGEAADYVCVSCGHFVCSLCTSTHIKKACTWFSLLDYASLQFIPKYSNTSIKDIEEQLLKLKKNVEATLDQINEILAIIKIWPTINISTSQDTLNTSSNCLAVDCETLKEAVKNKDYISVRSMLTKYKEFIREEHLHKNTSQSIDIFRDSKELHDLNKALKLLKSTYSKFCNSQKINNYVYGICRHQANYTQLCKFNTQTRRLVSSIIVPKMCTVTQITDRVFVSGGHNPTSNLVYELSKETECLIAVGSMKYEKCCHRTQVLSPLSFVSIGGRNESILSCCEEFFVMRNGWKDLPSLNKPRLSPATALLSQYLYAIGGANTPNAIERLDINKKDAWNTITVKADNFECSMDSVAFPISGEEIIILKGGYTNEVGIYNQKEEALKKSKMEVKVDYYYYNSVYEAGGKAYIIGSYNGHVHIFMKDKKVFEEIEYSDLTSCYACAPL